MKVKMPDRSKPFDGGSAIHYMRWRYGVPAKIGMRVRLKMPNVSSLHGKTGVITGAGPHIIVRPDPGQLPYKTAKRYRWRVHPLELEYLTAAESEVAQ